LFFDLKDKKQDATPLFFCRIRGYLSSGRKHGVNSSDAMKLLFRGELTNFAKKPE